MHSSKEEKVHEVFESIYDKYDYMNSVISFQLHKSWRNDTMKRMNVAKGAAALDICCGTADWTIQLAEKAGKNGRVVGLDFSKNMLSVGVEKVQKKQLSNVELVEGNAMSLPFEDNTFDYVTIGFGLRNVPDYQTVIKEMYRVLKPEGLAVCLETSQPDNKKISGIYSFYFKKIMPLLGKYLAGSYEQYSWLQESTMSFPNKSLLAVLFSQAGFARVSVIPYTMGAAAAHFAVKASSAKSEEEVR
ncbi:demethylmenaquinone methyltransferase / 2-methoxy-6-polyprenyl-1,4-benzoquinol methylase [Alteribacillus persepolensis]|uniref:Demethylmenaquinone methyltransferase n=1 Tax=Alteribacillus persepolensis TaxID=568899 RepID=A0A1G7ZGK2_9BACI|nr:demethylmenaquinone methyltransferase [Alteribacillus persepolensis]SDH07814.1 demethylmenaquinone methyltransferase / 2-methoxy-6-polyprenyl-1,4-benzoquinol methylase [Alteribacillus persepolensis]